LFKRLNEEFNNNFNQLDSEKGIFNYFNTCSLLQSLGFITGHSQHYSEEKVLMTELWNSVKSDITLGKVEDDDVV
jgi:hypothetical protein